MHASRPPSRWRSAPASISRPCSINGPVAAPLIEQGREIDAGADRHLDGGREACIDLHQVGRSGAVASELNFRIPFEIDRADEAHGLLADVLGHRDALAKYGGSAQRRLGPLRPLGETGMDVTV